MQGRKLLESINYAQMYMSTMFDTFYNLINSLTSMEHILATYVLECIHDNFFLPSWIMWVKGSCFETNQIHVQRESEIEYCVYFIKRVNIKTGFHNKLMHK